MISFALLILVSRASASRTPYQLAVSNDSFGPDGPWQAVQVGLGTPPQIINLLPAGLFQSIIYSKEVCDHFENVVCGTGGIFNTSESSTYDGKSMATYHPYGLSPDLARSGLDTLTILPAAGSSEEKVIVPKIGFALRYSDNNTRADYSGVFPPQIGHLSLGPNPNQPFGASDNVSPEVNTSLVPGKLQEYGLIDSISYGLHVGSAALKLPLSLWLGGYDASRVIGSIFSGPLAGYQLQIDLLDIAFGVDAGVSPFPFTSKQDILPSTNPLTVQLDTGIANLKLPARVCESLTQYLPVTFQSKYGVYLWNTSDPQYTRIVTSPSYLSFVFRAPTLSQGTLAVKVPFKLLNLTLFPPIAPTPTSYFPCNPTPSMPVYILGRSFLQAAFIGVNFSKKPGEWYLAQAPGPDIASSPSPVAFGENVTNGASPWSESWKNHWTVLADASQPSSNTSSTAATPQPSENISSIAATPVPSTPSSGDLSIGAKVGAATGVVGFMALLLAALYFFHHRRRKGRKGTDRQRAEGPPAAAPQDLSELAHEGINEAPMPDPVEMSSYPGPSHELSPEKALYEVAGHTTFRHELPVR